MTATLKRSDAILQGNKVQLERLRYTLRVTKATFGLSKSSNNPMITVEAEIVGARDENGELKKEIELASGAKAKVEGIGATYFLVLTPAKLDEVFMFHERLGNPIEEIDAENPDTAWLEGKFFDAVLWSEEQFLTGADRKPVLDATNQKVSNGWRTVSLVNQIIGVVDAPQG